MIHSNNTDGSQTFTDTASGTTEVGGKTLTANGQVQHDTAFYKFAISGVSFDGTGDYISTPTHSAWEFGTGDFAIAAWVRPTKKSANFQIVANYSGVPVADNWYLAFISATTKLQFLDSGGTTYNTPWNPTLNTWYHVEVDRSGNNFYMFIDGVATGAQNCTGMTLDATTSLSIGMVSDGVTEPFNGHMDEIIIKKGAALHTDNFTPPKKPYCD
uniref:Putative baseplate wedge initiator n=1 Tax=viral metagenome TaxID=1070528 RepID=A0A6M3K0R7_9ZZZZ